MLLSSQGSLPVLSNDDMKLKIILFLLVFGGGLVGAVAETETTVARDVIKFRSRAQCSTVGT